MFLDVNGFHEGFHRLLSVVVADGELTEHVRSGASVGSQFGQQPRRTKELLAVTLLLRNPRDRLLPADCRRVDLGYAFANYLWTLTVGASEEAIVAYNHRGAAFLDEESAFRCAVPHRLMGMTVDDSAPLREAIRILTEDRTSRRAIVPFIRSDDLVREPKDFPCMSSVQIFIRSGRLHMIVHMRSQSLVGVMPYDIFFFTMLQESLALHLEVPLGVYYHVVNSLHLYDDEFGQAERLLSCSSRCDAMMQMARPDPLSTEAYFTLEAQMRDGLLPNLEDLPQYWQKLYTQLQLTLNRNKRDATGH